MTKQEKQLMYSALIRLVDDDVVLNPMERRDILNELCRGYCDMSLDEILNKTKNNRKLRLKRGDKTTNDAYMGMAGEITMDTDNGIIRVHDGETVGGVAMARAIDIAGDWVVESQLPTAENNYTWYRKYKSGWVEMGGEINGTQTNADITITLPIIMANNHYTLIRTQVASNIQSYYPGWVAGYTSKTETDFKFTQVSGTNIWYVCGQSK